jgi:hypothetical protein
MIHLTVISVSPAIAFNTAMELDPLTAADSDYCAKTWLATHPSIACRPWRVAMVQDKMRITGWRRTQPDTSGINAYINARAVQFSVGEQATFAARFIATRRNPRTTRDAGEGYHDPKTGYDAWLRERLIDISMAADVESLEITRHSSKRVLRKASRSAGPRHVRPEIIPVVEALVALTIKQPETFEQWLLKGIGPQKGFGYGAFLPAPDRRESTQ